jgi:hypothetical protein
MLKQVLHVVNTNYLSINICESNDRNLLISYGYNVVFSIL